MEFNGWEILGKIRKVIKIIESDGWYLKRVSGDHRQYAHAVKGGVVTVSGHLDDDVMRGTMISILKQAGIKKEGGLTW